jgi:hypothetical protein
MIVMQLSKQNKRLQDLASMRIGRPRIRAFPELLGIIAQE